MLHTGKTDFFFSFTCNTIVWISCKFARSWFGLNGTHLFNTQDLKPEASGADLGSRSGGPSGVLTPRGGPWAQNLPKIRVFPLKLPENCMILKKSWEARGVRAPRAPLDLLLAWTYGAHIRTRVGFHTNVKMEKEPVVQAPFTQDAEHLATGAHKLWDTLWSMGVFTHTACKHHQRVFFLCVQICFWVLCEWGPSVGFELVWDKREWLLNATVPCALKMKSFSCLVWTGTEKKEKRELKRWHDFFVWDGTQSKTCSLLQLHFDKAKQDVWFLHRWICYVSAMRLITLKKKKKRLEIFQPLKEEGFYLILKHVACK